MATSTAKLNVQLLLDDKVSQHLKKVESQFDTFSSKSKKNWLAISGAVAGATVAITAITSALKKATDASSEVEGLQIRLEVLFGSVEEGNKVFKDMSELAARVPKTYQEIMQAATMMGGVVRGGSDEIKKLMPLIVDLSSATGISVQDVTSQMVRMYSAGAASADMFRERGVLAMLGFKAGATVTAQETMAQVIKAWEDPESKFKGASDKLAKTWTGALSMMDDAMFKLWESIGAFITRNPDFIKAVNDGAEAIRTAALALGALKASGDLVREDKGLQVYFANIKEWVEASGIANYGAALERIFNLGVQLSGNPVSLPRVESATGTAGPMEIDLDAQEAAIWQAKIQMAIDGTTEINAIEQAALDWKKQMTLDDKVFFINNEIEKNNLLLQMAETTQKQKEAIAAKNTKLVLAQSNLEKEAAKTRTDAYIQSTASMLSSMATFFALAQGESKKYAGVIKGLMIAEAVMNTAVGISKALKDYTFPVSLVVGAAVAAAGAAQIATIASQGFAKGTDSVPSMLTPGEMVIPRDFAAAIRSGDITIGGKGTGPAGEINVSIENANFSSEDNMQEAMARIGELLQTERRSNV